MRLALWPTEPRRQTPSLDERPWRMAHTPLRKGDPTVKATGRQYIFCFLCLKDLGRGWDVNGCSAQVWVRGQRAKKGNCGLSEFLFLDWNQIKYFWQISGPNLLTASRGPISKAPKKTVVRDESREWRCLEHGEFISQFYWNYKATTSPSNSPRSKLGDNGL